MSFKQAREMLLLSFESGWIDEEEFIILSEEVKSKTCHFSTMITTDLSWKTWTKQSALANFVYIKETFLG